MNKVKVLAICIEEIRSGKSTIEDCMRRYPELAMELRPLLGIATQLKPDEVTPSAEFRQRTRLNIFGEMQPVATSPWGWLKMAPARGMALALVILLAVVMAGGSTVYAAQSSLPGDTLYAVKTGMENLQLSVTLGAAAKADLHLEMLQRRIDEATQAVKLNRAVDEQALETINKQIDEAIKELSNLENREATDSVLRRLAAATLNQQLEIEQSMVNASESNKSALKQALEVTRKGNLVAQVAYANSDYLQHRPSVSDEDLDEGQFKIDGILLSVAGGNWNVGGYIVEKVHYSGKVPDTGTRVIVEGLVKDQEVYISRVEVSQDSEKPTRLEGEFGGTNDNGTVNIGGIPVTIKPNGESKLEIGEDVELETVDESAKMKVVDKEDTEDEKHETGNSTKISGILTSVNVSGGTIAIRSAGSQITVNVKEAKIKDEDGHTIKLSELSSLYGKTVKLDSIYKVDGLLFARLVEVE